MVLDYGLQYGMDSNANELMYCITESAANLGNQEEKIKFYTRQMNLKCINE